MKNLDAVNEPSPLYGDLPADANAQLKGSLQAMRRAAQRALELGPADGH